MKNNLKKYFLIILFFIVFLLLCMNTQCFATCVEEIPESFTAFNGNVYYNNCSSSVSREFTEDGVLHYIVLSQYQDGGYCQLLFLGFNESIDIKYNVDGSFIVTCDAGVSGGYQITYDGNLSIGVGGNEPIREYPSEYTVIYCCDCMMQYQDDFSSNFFGRPLQVEQGILPPIIQVIPLKRVLKEILMVLPVVLVTIVGLIGLRKALAFLSTILKRS